MVGATGGKGEPTVKVCRIADAQPSFKSDVQKYFGFPVSRKERGEKVTENKISR